jgi:hypothetical protein
MRGRQRSWVIAFAARGPVSGEGIRVVAGLSAEGLECRRSTVSRGELLLTAPSPGLGGRSGSRSPLLWGGSPSGSCAGRPRVLTLRSLAGRRRGGWRPLHPASGQGNAGARHQCEHRPGRAAHGSPCFHHPAKSRKPATAVVPALSAPEGRRPRER